MNEIIENSEYFRVYPRVAIQLSNRVQKISGQGKKTYTMWITGSLRGNSLKRKIKNQTKYPNNPQTEFLESFTVNISIINTHSLSHNSKAFTTFGQKWQCLLKFQCIKNLSEIATVS